MHIYNTILHVSKLSIVTILLSNLLFIVQFINGPNNILHSIILSPVQMRFHVHCVYLASCDQKHFHSLSLLSLFFMTDCFEAYSPYNF